MRLLKARKGNARPAFDDTKGGQQFEYDFLGNLRGFDVDMTAAGDGDFTDTEDHTIAGGFNAVNEPTNFVETAPDPDVIFASDAAGNLTYRETVSGGRTLDSHILDNSANRS